MFQADQQMKGKVQMKKIWITTLTIAILSSVLCSACSQEQPSPETLNAIRHATVLITMQAPNPDQTIKDSTFLSNGVGSLIEYQGEILLVTHNHWSILQNATIVKFFDADNNLIKVITKDRFVKSIVYSDAGTLVLRPPQELIDQLAPVQIEAVPQVSAGEVVEVVYRQDPARETAAVLEATVEEVTVYEGQPVYKLHCPEGHTIQPGDSGGGIWHEGVLVGNNWTVTAKANVALDEANNVSDEDFIYSQNSLAAVLPEKIK
jgi:hypothetical protein